MSVKGDPKSPEKNVPSPELPQPKVGDKEYIGFDNEIPHVYYYVGLKRWRIQKCSLRRTEEIVKKAQEHDAMTLDIAEKGLTASILLEKLKKDQKLTTEENEKLGNLQLELERLKAQRANSRHSMIREIIPLLFIEENNQPFDHKHFEDDDIPPSKWFLACGDMISFLEVTL